jgi:Flp pilus assembly protein CpaB
MIRPGDYVDVVAMLSVPATNAQGKQVIQVTSVSLFQNVLVLAIGQDISTSGQQGAGESRYKKEEKKLDSSAITLALNPNEANLLGFVQDQGRIRLVLRSPADAKIESTQPVSWDSLFQYLIPPEVIEARSRQPKETKPDSFVEIYRGLKKEEFPITNK